MRYSKGNNSVIVRKPPGAPKILLSIIDKFVDKIVKVKNVGVLEGSEIDGID